MWEITPLGVRAESTLPQPAEVASILLPGCWSTTFGKVLLVHFETNTGACARVFCLLCVIKATSIRVLLLGGGGCGKTTFVKQMKLNYRGGFSMNETSGESHKKDIGSPQASFRPVFLK